MKILSILSIVLVACGGDVFDPGDGGADAAQDAAPCDKCVDAGPFPCGDTTCSGADAVCVHPCCGGAIECAPRDDGGLCPPGLQVSDTCPPEAPCSNVCTPPPPFCSTLSQCPTVSGHDCYELCQ